MTNRDNSNVFGVLENLRRHREELVQELNKDGVWLFLATLGCMGLLQVWLRIISLILCMSFFFYRLWISMGDSEMERNAAINDAIEQAKEANEDARQLIAYSEKRYYGWWHNLMKSWVFATAFLFLFLCFFTTLVERELNLKTVLKHSTSSCHCTCCVPVAPSGKVAHP